MLALTRSRPEDREVTVYVKGFLARGEKPEHFDPWREGHRRLVASRDWGPRAHGYCWPSGRARIPIPKVAAAKVVWDAVQFARIAKRVGIASNVGLAVTEQVGLVALSFARQYVAASRSATERAHRLGARLTALSERYTHVRVVAHSLGCRHVIEAVAGLAPRHRPDEIHLCAPASLEADVADKLPRLARRRTWLYFTPDDLVLAAAFRLLARGSALGAAGPRRDYARLTSLDVGDHFGFWVHGEYKHRFPDFAEG